MGFFENAIVFSLVCGLSLRTCSLETWGDSPILIKMVRH